MLTKDKNKAKKIYFFLEKYPKLQKITEWIYIKLNTKGNKYRIRGKDNLIESQGSILDRVSFQIEGSNNQIVIGQHSILRQTRFIIKGSNHKIAIGENSRVNKGGCIWLEDNGCELYIGKNTTIERGTIAVTENGSVIRIGDNCMFSDNVDIRSGDSHSILDLETSQRINPAANVEIKEHVWLGNGVKVLKGVTIGENSVIGIGSVVSKNIPPNSVAVGVPAKVVKENVTWSREKV